MTDLHLAETKWSNVRCIALRLGLRLGKATTLLYDQPEQNIQLEKGFCSLTIPMTR